jgi:acetoin utilization deacetylase AcuC-like enzyme
MEQSFPVFYSDRFLTHDTGAGHPENAGRLRAAVDYLKKCQQPESKDYAWASSIVWTEPSSRPVLGHIYQVHDEGHKNAPLVLLNENFPHKLVRETAADV